MKNQVKIDLKVWVAYPFLLAAFPVLSLYAYNIEETTISMTLKPIALVMVGAAVFLFLSNLIFRNWKKSAIFTSLAVMIFFSHGHIHNLIGSLKYQVWRFEFGTDDTLFGIWLIMMTAVFFMLLRTKRDFSKMTGFLNLASLFLVLYPSAMAIPHEINRLIISSNIKESIDFQQTGKGIGYQPDIYYIILDRYGSNKTIEGFYGYDNSEFMNYLKEKGFYIAEDSVANYPRTPLSLASSLNMTYLDSVKTFLELIRGNELGLFLKSQGYRYLHIGSWAGPTKTVPIADVNFKAGELYLDMDEFTLKLFQTTVLSPIVRRLFPETALFEYRVQHRNRALYQFDRLKEIPKAQKSPKFVFAHIMLPHDPYVFNATCEKLEPAESELENFLSQLSCTNKLAMAMIDGILQDSAQPPVIVIQGDEGPYEIKYSYMPNNGYKAVDRRALQERARILNSYYLPGVDADNVLYSSITPVNSFRVILNLYFGKDLKLLPDRSYIFSEQGELYKSPQTLIDVTELLH